MANEKHTYSKWVEGFSKVGVQIPDNPTESVVMGALAIVKELKKVGKEVVLVCFADEVALTVSMIAEMYGENMHNTKDINYLASKGIRRNFVIVENNVNESVTKFNETTNKILQYKNAEKSMGNLSYMLSMTELTDGMNVFK